MITMAGPQCDVCGSFILLDPEMFPFRVAGIEHELLADPRCKKTLLEIGTDWTKLPSGPLRSAFEKANGQ